MLAATLTAFLLALVAGPAVAADSTTPAVTAQTFQIDVIGAVARPGKVQLKDGDRVTLALARAGAELSTNPDLSRVCIAHMATVTKTSVTEIHAPSVDCVDLFKFLERGDIASNPVLHGGDVVVVMARAQRAPAQQSN